MNAMPPFSPLRRRTWSRSRRRTSLSRHRAGTGRYAGLKVPTVCAHSPVYRCVGAGGAETGDGDAGDDAALESGGVVVVVGADADADDVDDDDDDEDEGADVVDDEGDDDRAGEVEDVVAGLFAVMAAGSSCVAQ